MLRLRCALFLTLQMLLAIVVIWAALKLVTRLVVVIILVVVIAVMFFGFVGRAWGIDKEASLLPNETMTIGEYTMTYRGTHRDVDHEKTVTSA